MVVKALAGLLVLALVSLARGVSAQDGVSVDISPDRGPCGTVISVSGAGFLPETPVVVVVLPDIPTGFESAEPVTTTDPRGAFSTQVTVPNGAPACPGVEGPDWKVVACSVPLCEPKASAAFTLVPGELPVSGTAPASAEGGSRTMVIVALVLIGAIATMLGSLTWQLRRTL